VTLKNAQSKDAPTWASIQDVKTQYFVMLAKLNGRKLNSQRCPLLTSIFVTSETSSKANAVRIAV